MALATAALVAMKSDMAQRPSSSSAHPLHLLSLSPIKIPLLTSPNPGKNNMLYSSEPGSTAISILYNVNQSGFALFMPQKMVFIHK